MKKTFKSMIMTAVLATSMLFTSAYSAFAATNTYKINNVSVSYTSSSVKTNCWEYANQIYNKIWGYRFSNNRNTDDNMIKNITGRSALTLNETNLKKYVSVAAIGSVLRTTNDACLFANSDNVGHSQIIVKKDANGFTVFESNIGKNTKYSREQYYTWKSYVNSWKKDNYKYIKYIKWYGAQPFSTCAESDTVYFPEFDYEFSTAVSSEMCLDVCANGSERGTNVFIYHKNNGPAQKFHLQYVGNGYYKIIHKSSGMVLDSDGVIGCCGNVMTWEFHGGNNQLWRFSDAGDGYYFIINKDGNYLDVYAGNTSDGTNVWVYKDIKSTAQKWKLTRV